MDIVNFAQQLKEIVKDVACLDLTDLDESYMSLSDFHGVIEVMNERIQELYYDGYSGEVDYYVDKMIEVFQLLKRFNDTYGL